jgi:hypothetical protein
MNLAKRVFGIAGVYGLIVILPLFLGPSAVIRVTPPLTHPVFYYGFAGTALAWQLAFLVIARDPVRYRPLMLPAIVEKLVFGIATIALFIAGEADTPFVAGALVDLVLGALFLAAWLRTSPARQPA